MRVTAIVVAHRRLCRVRIGAIRSDRTRRCDAGARTRFSQPRHSIPRKDPVYVCPMDPDVRSHNPGTCRRCGMNLVAGIPDPVEFHLDLDVAAASAAAGRPAVLQFLVHDPVEGSSRRHLQRRPREALSRVRRERGSAVLRARASDVCRRRRLPVADHVSQAGHVSRARRLLSGRRDAAADDADGLRAGRSAGAGAARARLLGEDEREHARVAASRSRSRRSPGMRTQLRFTIDPADGLEKYLGAWAHMLAASNDLIDMMHQHPFRVDERAHGRIRGRVSASAGLSRVGAVPARGRRQHRLISTSPWHNRSTNGFLTFSSDHLWMRPEAWPSRIELLRARGESSPARMACSVTVASRFCAGDGLALRRSTRIL